MAAIKKYMNELVELCLWRLEADEPNRFKPVLKKLKSRGKNPTASPAYSPDTKHLCFTQL
jgi:hypothetical protein